MVCEHTCQECEAECSGRPHLSHALTVPSAQIFNEVLPHEKHQYQADGHKQQVPEIVIIKVIKNPNFHSDIELSAVRTKAICHSYKCKSELPETKVISSSI